MKFNFIKPTLIFSIIGLFIPAFTAIILIALHDLISEFGIECSLAWTIVWILTSLAGLFLPIWFYKNLSSLTNEKLKSLKRDLNLFNLLEYTLIQSSFIPILTTGENLCYLTDGQNGFELVFTAWMSLPILILLSVFFNHKFKLMAGTSTGIDIEV